ncbi:hypothetical protein [Mycobacterium lepromatosis]|uniref:hypothetical protein n=1 Tax=Mycobacterium lepromatosis TaxID=480418 RepID=UPI000ABF3BD5|nr:hypothetical protein [Mycobacterium lepromatosis]
MILLGENLNRDVVSVGFEVLVPTHCDSVWSVVGDHGVDRILLGLTLARTPVSESVMVDANWRLAVPIPDLFRPQFW